jgi:adenylate kinase family enzyme
VERVAIVGCGGTGKSTLARTLGTALGLPVVHLDEHHWRPGWVPVAADEWRRWQEELVAAHRWVADGNYEGTFDLRFRRADTIVFLDLPRRVALVRVVRRWAGNRGREVQAPGCPERISADFLRWIWRYPRDHRPRVLAAAREHGAHARFVHLRSRRAVAAFLAGTAAR